MCRRIDKPVVILAIKIRPDLNICGICAHARQANSVWDKDNKLIRRYVINSRSVESTHLYTTPQRDLNIPFHIPSQSVIKCQAE